jgi:lysozyme
MNTTLKTLRVGALFAAFLTIGGSEPFAVHVSDSVAEGLPSTTPLRDLQDEPSRADLFALIVQAEKKNESEELIRKHGEIFNLYGPFTFPNDTVYDFVDQKSRTDSIFGIDISHHNSSDIPIEGLYLRNIKFAFMKASQGVGLKDGKFQSFWVRFGNLPAGRKVHRGAYHFLTAQDDAEEQASTYLLVLAMNGGLQPTDMPPVLDLEWDVARPGNPDRWINQTADQILDKALIWLKAVEISTGRKPLIYTNKVWWKERIGSESKFAKLSQYKVWIGDYSATDRAIEVPSVPNGAPWLLWQFTASSRFATGFADKVDADVFKGSSDQFYQGLGIARF